MPHRRNISAAAEEKVVGSTGDFKAPEHITTTSTVQSVPRKPLPSAMHRSSNTSRPSFAARLRKRWFFLTVWQKILVIAIPIAILVLILGLSIGLTTGLKTQNLPLPSNHGGPYTGDLTYYEPGLGACGVTSSSSENIVSIPHSVFDAAQTGSDPNQNPLCGRKLRVKRYKEGVGERSVDLTVVDRCVGCQPTDIDTTTSVFQKLADIDLGRVTVQWAWID